MTVETKRDDEAFCRAYLRTMDPERAATESGHRDGFALLGRKRIQERLEKMRSDAAGQLRREAFFLEIGRKHVNAAVVIGQEVGDVYGNALRAAARKVLVQESNPSPRNTRNGDWRCNKSVLNVCQAHRFGYK